MSTDKNDKPNGLFSNTFNVVMLVLLTGGVVANIVPLNSARPIDPERLGMEINDVQDVEARLWEDPFAAIKKHEERFAYDTKDKKQRREDEHINALHRTIEKLLSDSGRLKVVAVSVFGGSYVEAAESRRRSRFAVVSALNTHLFYPKNSEAIGYFKFDQPKLDSYEQEFNVPFEWYERRILPQSNVLVIWLDEEKFTTMRSVKLLSLFNKLSSEGLDVKMVGPTGTDMYNYLREELANKTSGLLQIKPEDKGADMYNHLREELANKTSGLPPSGLLQIKLGDNTYKFFSPGATVSDCNMFEIDKPPAVIRENLGKCIRKYIFPENKVFPLTTLKFFPETNIPLVRTIGNDDVPETNIPLVRTIGNDDVLSVALLWELWQRGVNRESWWQRQSLSRAMRQLSQFTMTPPEFHPKPNGNRCKDGLVLIGEQDSNYARRLSWTLENGFLSFCDIKNDLSGTKLVRRLSYLRGLDGVLPDRNKSGANAPHKDDREKSKDMLAQLKDAPKEHAEGYHQYDYLRRLADEINELDKNEKFAKKGIKAIGIVGSDVYDKLLILQALRSRFKDKIFFTTDLDARYLHADQKDWARNLVVASNFGLSLRPELQRRTMPFRDGYQTATYLATLMALNPEEIDSKVWSDKMNKWLDPQIFEIGRTKAIHVATPTNQDLYNWFVGGINGSEPENSPKGIMPAIHDLYNEFVGRISGSESKKSLKNINPPEKTCKADKLAECVGIEPAWPQLWPSFKHLFAFVLMIVFGFVLIAMASSFFHEMLRTAKNLLFSPANAKAAIFWRTRLGVLFFLLLGILMYMVDNMIKMKASLEQGIGEPFLWLEGISVWPNLVLSFIGLVLMLGLALVFRIWIRGEAHHIATRFIFDLPQTWDLKRSIWSAMLAGPYLDLTSFNTKGEIEPKSGGTKVVIAILWQNYLRATGWRGMIGWIMFSMVFGVALCVATIYVFDMPLFPHRGLLVEELNFILVCLNAFVLWLVIFWVVFQTRVCEQFIKVISIKTSLWPDGLLKREEKETGVPRAFLADYLDFKLVLSISHRVHWLIYLPFIPILFMSIARNDLFDTMYFPPVLIFFIGLVLVYALGCEVMLRRAAMAARNKALDYYEMLLWRTLAPPKVNVNKNPKKGSSAPGTVNGAVAGPAQSEGKPQSTLAKSKPEPPISAEEIKLLIERIRSTREGVFAPITEQPALHALLMPFGGFGGAQFFQYLVNLTP